MVKSVTKVDKLIFNYLDETELAIFSAYTDFYGETVTDNGILWIQTNPKNEVTALTATGKGGKTLCFSKGNADYEELQFILGDNIITTNKTDYEQTDKKYLMVTVLDNVSEEKGCNYRDFIKIKTIDDKSTAENAAVADRKTFLHLKNRCEGCLIEEDGKVVSGGFINFNDGFAVITDVYVAEKERKNGYGKEIVKKLLSCSKRKKVYLTTKEENTEFYEKSGFKKVREIYEYKNKEKL